MKKKQVMCLLLASVMVGTGGIQMLGGSGNSGTVNTVYAAETDAAEDTDKVTFPEYYPDDALVVDDEETIEKKITALINAMTQEEKFSFLGGNGTGDQGNAGSLPGVGRLGVPESKMYDGPAGVLSLYDTTNPLPGMRIWHMDMERSVEARIKLLAEICSLAFRLTSQEIHILDVRRIRWEKISICFLILQNQKQRESKMKMLLQC